MKRLVGLGVGLVGVLAAVAWLNLSLGSFVLSSAEIWEGLVWGVGEQAFVVRTLRLPRVVLAGCAGGVLALSGFFMQALIKNPLADPYIMGLTAGAGFGVNLLVLGIVPALIGMAGGQPLWAALGGCASLLLVVGLGFRSLLEDSSRLLIAGVAVSAIFTALTGMFIYQFADDDQVRRIVFWTFGSLSRATPTAAWVGIAMLGGAMAFGGAFARRLDVLVLGDVTAASLGMRVVRVKLLILLATSIVVGGVVAYTGPIGFVGMMIPHFCRALFGGGHRRNVVFGALTGATYLIACDALSRLLLPPAGLPIGIVTAILGVPFFLYILFSGKGNL